MTIDRIANNKTLKVHSINLVTYEPWEIYKVQDY